MVALVPLVERRRREVRQRGTGVERWPTPVSRMARKSKGLACGLGSAKESWRVEKASRGNIGVV